MIYDFETGDPEKLLQETLREYPVLVPCKDSILACWNLLRTCYGSGGKLLVAGNGGSAADSGHIVGELMKGFLSKRPLDSETKCLFKDAPPQEGEQLASRLQGALPAIDLTAQAALLTAYANDVDPSMIFAQQVFGYARPGDVFWGLSTSGSSQNVVNAARVAKAMGLGTIAITGRDGGILGEICDAAVKIPSTCTPLVQEGTMPVYHTLCMMLEKHFFG